MNNNLQKGIEEFITELASLNTIPIANKRRRDIIEPEFTIEYNASRILIILKYAGTKQMLTSKLRFAFYDFLLRYPICLKYVTDQFNEIEEYSKVELFSLDKKMIRHVSFAWDPDYYNYLAYLSARMLISVNFEENFTLELTELGKEITKKLETVERAKIVRRSLLIKKIFSKKSEKVLREYIQENFSFTVI